jgi:hypothetical protein
MPKGGCAIDACIFVRVVNESSGRRSRQTDCWPAVGAAEVETELSLLLLMQMLLILLLRL